jgi:hypothetical protein
VWRVAASAAGRELSLGERDETAVGCRLLHGTPLALGSGRKLPGEDVHRTTSVLRSGTQVGYRLVKMRRTA